MIRPLASIRDALIVAAVLLGASVAFVAGARMEIIAHTTVERGTGVLIGLLLALIGNDMPKTLEPLAARRCAPSASTAVQRFAGWAFFLAGCGYALAWLAAPVKYANAAAMASVAASVALVVARCAWTYRSRDGDGTARNR